MSDPAPSLVYVRMLSLPKRVVSDPLSDSGSPELANRVQSVIQRAGLPTDLDPQRGFDPGTYSILALSYSQMIFFFDSDRPNPGCGESER